MIIRPASPADLDRLAVLAAQTFPLAAPDDAAPESIAAFVAEHLSRERLAEYLADRDHDVLVGESGDDLTGWAMLVAGEPDDPDVATSATIRPTVSLSKFYVSQGLHGTGVSGPLMTAVLEAAERRGAAAIWLGVNQENERAQRFYVKQGFHRVGTKRFQVGARLEHDYVYERPIRSGR